VCTPIQPAVDDLASYPYTYLGGEIYASHRIEVTGVEVPGYTLSEPVFLPVLNSGEAAGSTLAFDWSSEFLDTATALALDVMNCPNAGIDDGYHARTQITLTMDLQESRRIFGVVAADAAAAQTWWNANTHANCNVRGSVEQAMFDWFLAVGGAFSTAGKYDIMNAYEWFLDQAYLQMSATVDGDGTTHVTIDHLAWGTTNLLNRMLYWGSASYLVNHLDSTKAVGWSGMEPWAWFEGLSYTGSFSASNFDFEFSAAVPNSLQLIALPGPDLDLDQVDDFSVWSWSPRLHDYLNDFLPGHPSSELDRYTGPAGTMLDTTPGSVSYGTSIPRHIVPITWDLAAGETWTFEFPTGNVVFYDPNLTPLGASPTSNDFVEIVKPLGLHSTKPASYGSFDPVARTWTVTGPTVTGGPDGSPGNYPLESWGAIQLPEPSTWLLLLTGVGGLGGLGGLHRLRARRRAAPLVSACRDSMPETAPESAGQRGRHE
jgi:hypothetical protein